MGFFSDIGDFVTTNINSVIDDATGIVKSVVGTAADAGSKVLNTKGGTAIAGALLGAPGAGAGIEWDVSAGSGNNNNNNSNSTFKFWDTSVAWYKRWGLYIVGFPLLLLLVWLIVYLSKPAYKRRRR